jgi:hypothetical protein
MHSSRFAGKRLDGSRNPRAAHGEIASAPTASGDLEALPREKPAAPRDHFSAYLEQVRQEGRYRCFVDLERRASRPPFAIWRSDGAAREVVGWCSNDYLGMGRHPAAINAMLESAVKMGAGPAAPATFPAIATRF